MNDDEISELFRPGDVPPRGPRYWQTIEATLTAVDHERAVGIAGSPPHDAAVTMLETVETNGRVQRRQDMQTPIDFDRSTNRTWFLVAAASIVVVLAIGAVLLARNGQSTTTGVAEPAPPADTADDESTPTTADAPPSTQPPPEDTDLPSTPPSSIGSEPINQAEPNLQYDYGFVESFETINGQVWISFDRSGFGEDQLSGPDLDFEPRYELATDFHGGLNVNPTLRTYPLAANASVLLLNPSTFEQTCAGEESEVPYLESDLVTLVSYAYSDGALVSLTFDERQEVSLVRDQRGC